MRDFSKYKCLRTQRPVTQRPTSQRPTTEHPRPRDPRPSDHDPETCDPKEARVQEARGQEAGVQEAGVREAAGQEARVREAGGQEASVRETGHSMRGEAALHSNLVVVVTELAQQQYNKAADMYRCSSVSRVRAQRGSRPSAAKPCETGRRCMCDSLLHTQYTT